MQATDYTGSHEYIDYGEVVAVLDEWRERERDWPSPFQQAMIAIVLIRLI